MSIKHDTRPPATQSAAPERGAGAGMNGAGALPNAHNADAPCACATVPLSAADVLYFAAVVRCMQSIARTVTRARRRTSTRMPDALHNTLRHHVHCMRMTARGARHRVIRAAAGGQSPHLSASRRLEQRWAASVAVAMCQLHTVAERYPYLHGLHTKFARLQSALVRRTRCAHAVNTGDVASTSAGTSADT